MDLRQDSRFFIRCQLLILPENRRDAMTNMFATRGNSVANWQTNFGI